MEMISFRFIQFGIAVGCIISLHFTDLDLCIIRRDSTVAFFIICYSRSFALLSTSVFIIAFVCYGWVFQILSHLREQQYERKNSTRGEKNVEPIERKAYNFCIEKLLHQSYRRNNKEARNYGNSARIHTQRKKGQPKMK